MPEMTTSDGIRLHYEIEGREDGPPLLFSNALGTDLRLWDAQAEAAAGLGFRVVRYDQRGHGESDWAPDYHEQRLVGDLAVFVDALGLEALSLVGFSIGGYAACAYTLLNPERVTRLVLAECFVEDPSVIQSPTPGTEHIRVLRALPAEFHGCADAVTAEAADAFRPLAPYAAEVELRRWMLDGLTQGSDARWTWTVDPVLRMPGPPERLNPTADIFEARLAKVTNPTLMVVGAESFIAESAERVAAANRESGKRLVLLPETGHWVPLDNPHGFLEVVGGFLMDG